MQRPARTPKKKKASFLVKFVAFLALGALILIPLFLVGLGKTLWKDGERFTLVIGSETPTVVSFSPIREDIILFTIPASTNLELPHGYGTWPAGSAWKLGIQEEKEGKLLSGGITKTFGITVDGFIGEEALPALGYKTPGSLAAKLRVIVDGRETNLGILDRIKFVLKSSSDPRNREYIDLERLGIIRKYKIPDGTESFRVLEDKAERELGERLADEVLRREQKTISIVNRSGVSGLGRDLARIIKILGVQVTSVRSEETADFDCKLKLKQPSERKLAERLARIWDCEILKDGNLEKSSLEFSFGEKFGARF